MKKKRRRGRAQIKRSSVKGAKKPMMFNRKYAGGKENHTEEALRTQLTKAALTAHPVAAQTFAIVRDFTGAKSIDEIPVERKLLTREEAIAKYGEPEQKRPLIRRSK